MPLIIQISLMTCRRCLARLVLVILPEGDLSLQKENRKMISKLKAKDEEVVALKLKATRRKISRVG